MARHNKTNVAELATRRRRPARTIVTTLPQEPVTSWTYSAITRALDEHERGSFVLSAPLVDAFGRDDRITACLNTRVGAILGRHGADFSIEPSDRGDKRRTRALAADVESWWYDAISEKELQTILLGGITLGVHISRVDWVAKGGRWLPQLRPWPMEYVWWDETRRCYMVQAKEGLFEARPGDPNWLIYAPGGSERPWMSGAVRSLGIPFLLRTFSWRDWARFSERHGMPIIAIEEPAEADEDAKAAFFESMKTLGRGGVLRLPQQGDGQGFGVSFIEARDTSWESFKAFGERLETAIAVRILGQNLTTEVQSGSRAAATVHDRVRQDYMDEDAESLSTELRDGILKPWVSFHYPPSVDPNAAPWPTWNTDAPEDRSVLADTSLKGVQFIQAARDVGLRVDVAAYLKRLGIPMLEGEPVEGPDDEPEPELTPPVVPPDGPEEPNEDTAATSVRLASGDAVEDAQGFVDGQRYVDDLGRDAALAASRAMAPALDAVLSLIESAESLDDLRGKLAETYRGMDQREFQRLTERAMIMAELAGRFAVIEDL